MAEERDLEIVIVGAGFGGIAAAIELQSHGLTRHHDPRARQRASAAPGCQNSYPGAACDVPSHLYSFSFAQRRDWSRLCSPQDEILEYLAGRRARLRRRPARRAATSTSTACAWDDDDAPLDRQRRRRPRRGRPTRSIIATGQLHQPAFPRIDGPRHVRAATASTPPAGTTTTTCAASASPSSAPARAPCSSSRRSPRRREQLTVFQRTGNWFMPRRNRPTRRSLSCAVRARARAAGAAPALHRSSYYSSRVTMMIRHPRTLGLRRPRCARRSSCAAQIKDPELRRKVWPDYTFGCKRVLFSSHFLPALQRPNVELVAERDHGGRRDRASSPPTARTTTSTASSTARASRR